MAMRGFILLLWGLWNGGLLREGGAQELAEEVNRTRVSVCAQTSPLPTSGDWHTLHQVSDGHQLVTSTRGARGQLVSCSLKEGRGAVESFMHQCRAGSSGQGVGTGTEDPGLVGFAGAKLACQIFLKEGAPGTLQGQPHHPAIEGLHRSKRGFTYPGTLWCGAGNSAENYHQLGELRDTDACCREHDHCKHVIHPFTHNYGYRNLRWHTISHCACDNDMKDCLRQANTTSSRVVGQAYFNVIQVPCFEFVFEEQCVERFWYGWCKKYNTVAVAVPQTPILYDYGGDLIDRIPISQPKNEGTDTSTAGQDNITAEALRTTSRSLVTTVRLPGTTSRLPGTTARPPGTTARRPGTRVRPPRTTVRPLLTTARPPGTTVNHAPDSPSEEPTLGQVIQATEDLLKVMVTTISPSTATDANIESVTKKQRKNKKRKKGERKHRKGKGQKGKKKALSKNGDLTPTSLVLAATLAVPQKDLWVDSLRKAQSGELERLLLDPGLDLGGKQVVFNDVLNDEPARDEVPPAKATLAAPTTNDDAVKKSTVPTPVGPTAEAEGQKKKRRRKDRKGGKRRRENPRNPAGDPAV